MTSTATHLLVQQLRQLTARTESLSDAELVRRFTTQREEEAFAALLRRHGPMVLRVCRRVLHDEHSAEDAFQATFLVLSRKAGSLRRGESVGSWLYGIAFRLSLQARTRTLRQQFRERHSVPPPPGNDPLAEVSVREARAILDEELGRLPEKYRAPLVLCYLEGLARDEAARRLGWPMKLVKSRLQQGRARLHDRLRRRGLTLPAALLALLLAEGSEAATVPAELMRATLKAVRVWTAGGAANGISAQVATLAEGMLRSIVVPKLKVALGMLLLASAFAAGAGMLAQEKPAAQQAEPSTVAKASAPAKAKEQPRMDRYGDPLPPGALARMGTIRLRRGRTVFALPQRDAFLSVAPGVGRMDVCTWRMSTGERLHHFESPVSQASAALSPDGKTLANSGIDSRRDRGCTLLLDLASGKETAELAGAGIAYALAFAPDGKTLATAGEDKTLGLWNRHSGTELRRFEGAKDLLWSVAFSPDGKILASSSFSRWTVRLWDTATGRELRTLEDEPGFPGLRSVVVFSPDGKTVAAAATGEKNNTVRLWDVATGMEVRQFQTDLGNYSLAFSPDGKILAAGGSPAHGDKASPIPGPIYLWDVSSGRLLHRLPGHVFTVTSLAFSPDGKRLISADGSSVMKVWDVAAGKEVVPFAEHESWIMSVAFSPDGRSLASGSLDGTIRLWEPVTGKLIRAFEGGIRPQVLHVAFAPDGRTLVSDRLDGALHFWDVATGQQKRQLKLGAEDYFFRFVYSPDGRTLAVWGPDKVIRLLDAATGAEKHKLPGGLDDGVYLCFSPDGRTLAVLSFSYQGRNSILQIWDVATGAEKHKRSLAARGPIVFSPDGKTLLGGSGDNFLATGQTERIFHVWDVATGEDHPFKVTQPARAESLAISPDGRMLAWGDAGGVVTLWELAAGQVRRRLKGHFAYVKSLDFSPDGKTLASGGADTTVLVWDVTGRPARRADTFSAEQLWTDLADKDAAKAFDAIGLLTAAPEQAVPMLKDKLKSAPAPADRTHVARLIADLDSERFEVRQKAMEELRQLGERAEPGLRAALKGKLPLEARKRVEELLEGIRAVAASPERLRELRAVEVLEHIGTLEARQVLQSLADGAPAARLTQEARAALERMGKRQPMKP